MTADYLGTHPELSARYFTLVCPNGYLDDVNDDSLMQLARRSTVLNLSNL